MSYWSNKLWLQKKWQAISCVLLSLVIFLPTWQYGFTTDYLSWFYKYEKGNWFDALACFGYDGLHQVFHIINYPIHYLAGDSPFLHYVPYAILHGLNTFLFFRVLLKVISQCKIGSGVFIPLVAGLLFFISPYQVETLTWKVCFHYLLCVFFMLLSWRALIQYLQNPNEKSLKWHHICFVLGLLTLELSLALPFIFATYSLIVLSINKPDFVSKWHLLSRTFGIQVFILVGYFLTNKLFFGEWVGHYGAEKHLNLDPLLIGSIGLKYFGKYMSFAHFFPFEYRSTFYVLLEQKNIVFACLSVLIACGGIALILFNRLSARLKLAFFGLLAFFMGIFPIANLYFMWLNVYENDRYGYLASVFFAIFIASLISLLPKKLRWLVAALIISVNAFFFSQMISKTSNAGKVNLALVDKFEAYDKEKIIFLAEAENFDGVCLFRDYSNESSAEAFKESLDILGGRPYKGKIRSVAQVNMMNVNDGVKVDQIDSLTLRVMITSDGTWFWKHGLGLTNYSNDMYKVENNGWYYDVTFFENPEDWSLLYFKDLEWKEFNIQ